jgi:hypothetical protein
MHPRGIRNNNPLNIRKGGSRWKGMAGDDGEFIIFEKPEFGFRAAAKIIASYNRRGVKAVDDIITTWAPEHENPTGAYAKFVKKRVREHEITVSNFPALYELFAAMTEFENGENPYTPSTILRGIHDARA